MASCTLGAPAKCCQQHGYYCPEVFSVLDMAPIPDDISICWHKIYYASYLTGNPASDEVFDGLVENEVPGARLPCDSAEAF